MEETSAECEYEESEFVPWVDEFTNNDEFCNWLIRVPDEFIENGFNLTGLEEKVDDFDKALDIILDQATESDNEALISDAPNLYMLIHQRYLQTQDGFLELLDKYENGDYGYCPRLCCENQKCLPYGVSSNLYESHCYKFCPRCNDIYAPSPRSIKKLDGAAFGPSISAMLVIGGEGFSKPYPVKDPELKIFGFKVGNSFKRLIREEKQFDCEDISAFDA